MTRVRGAVRQFQPHEATERAQPWSKRLGANGRQVAVELACSIQRSGKLLLTASTAAECAGSLSDARDIGYTANRFRRRSRRCALSASDWIEVATEALVESGMAAVSVEPLAARLGATKGSFYHHFENRDALVKATLDAYFGGIRSAVSGRIQPVIATTVDGDCGLSISARI